MDFLLSNDRRRPLRSALYPGAKLEAVVTRSHSRADDMVDNVDVDEVNGLANSRNSCDSSDDNEKLSCFL